MQQTQNYCDSVDDVTPNHKPDHSEKVQQHFVYLFIYSFCKNSIYLFVLLHYALALSFHSGLVLGSIQARGTLSMLHISTFAGKLNCCLAAKCGKTVPGSVVLVHYMTQCWPRYFTIFLVCFIVAAHMLPCFCEGVLLH